ncbi:MAG TPA: 2-dehydropantoate 2-reductase [Casimicrobiaceae bacterium]|nr:2-dehydropantoate 2-reductase [Casimicrobiaceae bacterium]
MRIAVMGAGGVGGYFGARLAHAGHDVAFVARGRHLLAMKERGLRVTSTLGDVHLARPVVTDDPSTLGWFDAVLFAVKLWDTESAAAAVKPLLAAGGVVVPFQNGVESIERVGAVVGPAQVMGGVAYIAAKIAEPGVVAHTGTMARLRFGTTDPAQAPVAEALLAACKGAGVEAELVSDIRKALWMKFVFLVGLSGVTAATRQPIGVIRADPDLRATFEAAMRETWSVGRARGVALPDDFVADQMRFGDGLPAEMKASMAHDLEAGNRLEAPWLSGAVARMAKEAGGEAPVNATLYAAVKPYLMGRAATDSGGQR